LKPDAIPGITFTSILDLLLIEDNPADALLVLEALQSSCLSADAMIASDGEQTLQISGELEFQPDFIILDLNLPGIDGHALLEHCHPASRPPIIDFFRFD